MASSRRCTTCIRPASRSSLSPDFSSPTYCVKAMVRSSAAAFLLAVAPAAGASAEFAEELVAAAIAQTSHAVRYDGSYRPIPYPGGDVPAGVGVCTDVVIRAYRAVGVDLQQRVHEDMKGAFSAYPKLW